MCSGSEVGSYLRLIDSCITQLKAHGPSRACNESKEDEEETPIATACSVRQEARSKHQATLEATQGQIDSFFSQNPYKCYLEEVASVGD